MIRWLDLRKITALMVLVLLTFFAYEGLMMFLEAADSKTTQEEAVTSMVEAQPEVKAQSQEKKKKLVGFDNDEERLKFYDQDGKLITTLDRGSLDLESNFPVKNWPDWHDSVHIGQTVVRKGQQFLFPVATSFYCGANNCIWHLYSYNIGDPKPQVIFKRIFGNIMEIMFSPNESKIAVLSSVHGGHCNSGEYLYLLDRKRGATTKVNDLNLEEYWVTHVDSLDWVDNFTLKAKIANLNCDPQERRRYEQVKRGVVCTFTDVSRVGCRVEEESEPKTITLPPA
jgi:hypothetical protein